MHLDAQPVARDIALVGGGHSHVGVLRHFAMQPLPGVRISRVRTDADTPQVGIVAGAAAHAVAVKPVDRFNQRWLALISTGDRFAVASQALSAVAMRCGGCGAKVGASVLSRALADLVPRPNDAVLIGLHAGDAAAAVRVPPGKAVVHTVDFFRAFIEDPYVFGQIAANHALGNIFVMGAESQSATAIATLPPGLEDKIEEQLRQMMSGAVQVLDAAGCALVGGHTGEGSELVLTKPIGTGTLLAAHARLVARGRWVQGALDMMRQSSQDAARVLRAHGATACTDLTGFGLLGHLLELVRASGVDAQLSLSALPLLEGAQECVAQGIVSSLQAANVRLRRAMHNQEACADHPHYPLLFDPQTAGGLLASVPEAQAQITLVD